MVADVSNGKHHEVVPFGITRRRVREGSREGARGGHALIAARGLMGDGRLTAGAQEGEALQVSKISGGPSFVL